MKVFLKALSLFFLGLIIIAVAGVFLIRAGVSDNLSKRQIFNLVEKHSETIIAYISENNFDDTLSIKGVKKASYKDGVVDFYCGGKGVGSETCYYGFYYSETAEPLGMYFGTNISGEFALIPDGDGFSYKEENSDNYFYTEKILKNFYYYESHF